MTREEYERRRSEIVESYIEEIDEHESAGCHGDAEISRKWMRRKPFREACKKMDIIFDGLGGDEDDET